MIRTTTHNMMNLGIESEDLLRYAEEDFNLEPRQHVIDTLLRFSRSLEVKSSALVGKIESVTN